MEEWSVKNEGQMDFDGKNSRSDNDIDFDVSLISENNDGTVFKQLNLVLADADFGEIAQTSKQTDASLFSDSPSGYSQQTSVRTSTSTDINSPFRINTSPQFPQLTVKEQQLVSHANLVELLRQKYKVLKEEVDPRNMLADTLFERQILSEKDFEHFTEAKSRVRKVDILIKALVHDSKACISGLYDNVLDIFKQEGIAHILQDTGANAAGSPTSCVRPENNVDIETVSALLYSDLPYLAKDFEENLEPKDIIDDLLVSGVLSFLDHEDVMQTTRRLERVKTIVDHIQRAGESKFKIFVNALCAANPHFIRLVRFRHNYRQMQAKHRELELQQRGIVNKVAVESTVIGVSMMELKLNFEADENVGDVEMNIVETNNPSILRLEEEAMDIGDISIQEITHSSVVIRFKAMSEEAARKLTEAIHKPTEMQRLINQMLTQEQLCILKDRKLTGVKIKLSMPPAECTIQQKCYCKLSKAIIVSSFTYLGGELTDFQHYIDAFVESSLVEDSIKQELINLWKSNSPLGHKKEQFLRTLLRMPDEYVCLFEREIRRSNQKHIIQKLLTNHMKDQGNGNSCSVGPQEIRSNHAFLLGEIEPKMFLSVFENQNEITERMMSVEPRRTRCARFLSLLLDIGQPAIEKFCKVLEHRKMDFVIDVLCKTDVEDDGPNPDELRRNILQAYSTLLQEIEPTRLKDKLVHDGVFSGDEFEQIYNVSVYRRERVVWLLRNILRKNDHAVRVFIDALKLSDYMEIVSKLTQSTAPRLDCPSLRAKIQEKKGKGPPKSYIFSAEFDITWVKGSRIEPYLKLCLPDIFSNAETKELDKNALIETWISNNTMVTESDGPEKISENDKLSIVRPGASAVEQESSPKKATDNEMSFTFNKVTDGKGVFRGFEKKPLSSDTTYSSEHNFTTTEVDFSFDNKLDSLDSFDSELPVSDLNFDVSISLSPGGSTGTSCNSVFDCTF